MEQASFNLPAVTSYINGLPIYFLTGKKYIHQTLFCIQSLVACSLKKFSFTLIDDGSFDTSIIDRINRQLPGARIVTADEIERNLKHKLPENSYPYLHQKRKVYPHIKKLTDIHTLPGTDWKLVLDSDMLFWQEPVELIDWIIQPENSLYMVDSAQSYGYSLELMERLSGSKIKPLVNVGAIGLNSNQINWRQLESWICELELKEGTSYYLEQALSAMIIGNRPSTVVDSFGYIVNPGKKTSSTRQGILHHYVDLSKKEYLTDLWMNFIR